ncbi:MAG TPA: hypothetical protein VG267_03730 [Terracidiphilus sp.]|jgi:hypothetical protein|nr:hypothetical protein [Terracidiphilus sp.]
MLLPLRIPAFVLLACLCADAQPSRPAPETNKGAVAVEMANVLFRYSPSLTVFIVRLRGSLIPTPGHSVPSFNDPASFVLGTDAAEMRMSTSELESLMNSWLLRSPKAQLKNVRITAQGDRLLIRGTMKKGVPIPFAATAEPGLTSDNRIRIAVQQVKTAHVPLKGLMDSLGLSLDDLISQNGLHGLSVDKDSLLIDPQTAFPPPQLRAKITGVRVSNGSLVLTFGHGAPTLPRRPWKNYLALRGGSVEYGREQMFDSDLIMIDSTPADPFEFYLRGYWCQMVSGTIKVTPEKALRIFVPDYSKIPPGACRAHE